MLNSSFFLKLKELLLPPPYFKAALFFIVNNIMKNLIDEVVAEIKRDISISNTLPLQELFQELIKDNKNIHIIRRYLSEFPELREPFKDPDC